MKLLLAFFCLLAAVSATDKVSYQGYKVFELFPENELQLEQIAELRRSPEYDFWRLARDLRRPTVVMVPPRKMAEFNAHVAKYGIRSQVKIQNVQDLILADEASRGKSGSEMNWTEFHELETIYEWLKNVTIKYENTKTVAVGSTYENRTILALEINFGKNLTGVVIQGATHARDWLAPAGTSWVINKILQSSNNSVFRQFNYLYIPVLNPDGYVYSWNKDRLWRKTRKPYKSTSGKIVYGADTNRNYDVHWDGGADPEDPMYPGPHPFSEIEIKSTTDYLKSVEKERHNDIFLSYHVFGDALMYPWAWCRDNTTRTDYWNYIGLYIVDAWAAVADRVIYFGAHSWVLYEAGGTSLDWYYTEFNASISFLHEMKGESFVSPPSDIIESGKEHLSALYELFLEYLYNKK